MDYSPAQMLMGKVLRSTLLSSGAILKPAIPAGAHNTLQYLQQRQCKYYDRGIKRLTELQASGSVHMRPAVVSTKRAELRSYDIVKSSSQQYICNRRHLKKTPSTIHVQPEPDHLEDVPITTPDTGAVESVGWRALLFFRDSSDQKWPSHKTTTQIRLCC